LQERLPLGDPQLSYAIVSAQKDDKIIMPLIKRLANDLELETLVNIEDNEK